MLYTSIGVYFTLGIMKQLAALTLLFFSLSALGADEFGVEQPFENPDKIPYPVASYLSRNLAKEINLCYLKNIDDAFEAKFVKISSNNKAIFVKPKAWCLCGVYNCPIWLFQIAGNRAKPVLYSGGTSGLDILDKKTNGYRLINDYSVHGRETTWAWDGTKYRETVTKIRSRNEEKSCVQVETYHHKNGKLKKVSVSCEQE